MEKIELIFIIIEFIFILIEMVLNIVEIIQGNKMWKELKKIDKSK